MSRRTRGAIGLPQRGGPAHAWNGVGVYSWNDGAALHSIPPAPALALALLLLLLEAGPGGPGLPLRV